MTKKEVYRELWALLEKHGINEDDIAYTMTGSLTFHLNDGTVVFAGPQLGGDGFSVFFCVNDIDDVERIVFGNERNEND